MKTAGDILSALFDEQFMKKAQSYSKFFDSWKDITEKNGIAAAADHSQIKDLDRGILLIEIDHPGWKQVLQTKQSKLLNDFRIRFPELNISGISFMLGSGKPQDTVPKTEPQPSPQGVEPSYQRYAVRGFPLETAQEPSPSATVEKETETEIFAKGYDAIKDEEFREKLIRIGKNISASEKSS